MVPPLADIEAARGRIRDVALRTPLVRLDVDGGAEIYLKLENLQPIGSFKIRGAANAMARLSRETLARGVLTASAGNMAQGVAFCARRLGVPCTVIAPDTAPATKTSAIERLGGRVIKVPFDRWWETFEERHYPGVDATFIHAFDDLDVMAGNGTIGLEILEDLEAVDAIVVPWGGGGLSCGIAAAVQALKPDCRIYAAEVDTAAPLAAALAAGEPRVVDYRPSFVDGIGSKTVLPSMFERARHLLAGALGASLEEVAAAVRLLLDRNRIVAEGAGACPVACALAGKAGPGRIVCVVSGGNLGLERLRLLLTAAGPGGPVVNRAPVQSRSLAAIGYDEQTETLEVQFRHGGVYRYFEVPAAVYEALMAAASRGGYLAERIKGAYRFTQV
jgi:threonine dehydratase